MTYSFTRIHCLAFTAFLFMQGVALVQAASGQRPPILTGFFHNTSCVEPIDSGKPAPARDIAHTVTFGAGGNVNTLEDSPKTEPLGNYRLVQSSFGGWLPGNIGYYQDDTRNAETDLIAKGNQSRQKISYRTISASGAWTRKVTSQVGWGLWINLSTPADTRFLADDGTVAYDDADVEAAENAYASALSVNPLSQAAAKGLLECCYERMAPRLYLANESLVQATADRITGVAVANERNQINRAIQYTEAAIEAFLRMTGFLPDAAILEGSYHAGAFDYSAIQNMESDPEGIAPRLLRAYARALAIQIEAQQRLAELDYLAKYKHPCDDPSVYYGDVLADMDEAKRHLLQRTLIFEFSQEFDTAYLHELNRAIQSSQDMDKLAGHIRQNVVAFPAAVFDMDGQETLVTETYRLYSPDYVPFLNFGSFQFLPGQSYNSSYGTLRSDAITAHGFATGAATDFQSADRQMDSNYGILQDRCANIRSGVWNELGQLCGVIDESGELVPNLMEGMLPLVQRTHYQQTESGQIAIQWQRVEQSLADIEIGLKDMESLAARIAMRQETAAKIANKLDNLAHLYLANGERLASLEMQAGNLRATRIRIEAARRQQNGLLGTIMNFAVKLIASGGNPVLALAATISSRVPENNDVKLNLLAAAGGLQMAYDAASNWESVSQSARSEADMVEALARIDAQKQRIAAMEKAEAQFVQRDQVLITAEENVFNMMLDMERKHMDILELEMKHREQQMQLGAMFQRVAYLVQELHRAAMLTENSTVNSPDFRLVRDKSGRNAEASFKLAQEKTYRAVKFAEYFLRASGDNPPNAILKNVMNARNIDHLESSLRSTDNELIDLLIARGDRSVFEMSGPISLKNRILSTPLSAINTEDKKEWQDYLKSCIVLHPTDAKLDQLVIPFALWPDASAPAALWYPNAKGMMIHCPEGAGSVQVDLLGNFVVANKVRGEIRAEGVSAFRTESYELNSEPDAIRTMVVRMAQQPNGEEDPVWCDEFQASVNNSPSNSSVSSSRLHEQSPFNSRWVLRFYRGPADGTEASFFNAISAGKVTDIHVKFRIAYWAN